MPAFRLPLSGDVNQVINPWNWFIRAFGNQVGLININLGKSSDPVLEERILEDVGTYGRQIGQMGDALRVLFDHVDLGRLNEKETLAIAALRYQLDEIDRIKATRQQQTRLDAAAPKAQKTRTSAP